MCDMQYVHRMEYFKENKTEHIVIYCTIIYGIIKYSTER